MSEVNETPPLIMTPDHPEFQRWLSIPPPDAYDHAGRNDDLGLVVMHPDSGILSTVSSRLLDELIYDARLFWDDEDSTA